MDAICEVNSLSGTKIFSRVLIKAMRTPSDRAPCNILSAPIQIISPMVMLVMPVIIENRVAS